MILLISAGRTLARENRRVAKVGLAAAQSAETEVIVYLPLGYYRVPPIVDYPVPADVLDSEPAAFGCVFHMAVVTNAISGLNGYNRHGGDVGSQSCGPVEIADKDN